MVANEFDVANGGPYELQIEVTEPFVELAGMTQKLSARHFVCGNEALLHYVAFAASAVAFGLLAILLLFPRFRACVLSRAQTAGTA